MLYNGEKSRGRKRKNRLLALMELPTGPVSRVEVATGVKGEAVEAVAAGRVALGEDGRVRGGGGAPDLAFTFASDDVGAAVTRALGDAGAAGPARGDAR